VLGGGVDDIYPPDNAGLYDQIVEQGAVVSESPMGARAQARDFPRRNRIISGLSRGVVVVEAEIRSGSLITARLANEQGREVFAVPGSPLDPRSKGPNELLRQGAHICEGVDDILRGLDTLRTLSEPDVEDPFGGGDPDGNEDPAFLDRVAALLSPTPTPRDEIARALDVPVAQVAAALLELSLVGRASLLPGGLASL
jgi:DNA processing protein